MTEPAERTVMVFLRDRERDIGTGYKTRVALIDGRWDDEPWRTGSYDPAVESARRIPARPHTPAG